MATDIAAEAAAITAGLRALAPEPTAVPIIRTSRPFYGARVGDLRATASGWLRGHRQAAPAAVAALAEAGFLVNAAQPDVVRLAPPLIVTADQADALLAALPAALDVAR